MRTNSESGIPSDQQVEFYRDYVFKALGEAGRRVTLDLRGWVMQAGLLKAAEGAGVQPLPRTPGPPPLFGLRRVGGASARLARQRHAGPAQGGMPPKHRHDAAAQGGPQAPAAQGPGGAVVGAAGESARQGDGHVKLLHQHGSSHGPPFT